MFVSIGYDLDLERLTRASMATINSTTLPSVALRSPPIVCPTRRLSSSVAKPSNFARGMMASRLNTKTCCRQISCSSPAEKGLTTTGCFSSTVKWRIQEMGMQTRRTLSQEHFQVALNDSFQVGSCVSSL